MGEHLVLLRSTFFRLGWEIVNSSALGAPESASSRHLAFDKRTLFSVEGNIGSGKSTFLRLIGSKLNAQVVCEPLEMWQNVGGQNLLEVYYQDQTRWTYTFQSYALLTLIIAQQEQAQNGTFPFQLTERSIHSYRYCFTQHLHDEGRMNDLEWKLYDAWASWLSEYASPVPAGFIYLRTEPDVCFQRLNKRNRSEEKPLAQEYLAKIHQRHESWLMCGAGNGVSSCMANGVEVPLLVLDCSEDFEHNQCLQERHAERVMEFLYMYGTSVSQQRPAASLQL